MGQLPRISIIVPNYNAATTLARTLKSLVDQKYPDLEILVADGGSTDGSVEIIRQFEAQIAWWVSEKDRGQSHAINKGREHATGEVMNWLCSDDYLLEGALARVGRAFVENPQADIVVGATRVDVVGNPGESHVERPGERDLARFPSCAVVPQPSVFFHRRLLEERRPLLDESLHYALDQELWCYFWKRGARWHFVEDELAVFTMDGRNKTSVGGMDVAAEIERVYLRYTNDRIPLTFWHKLIRHPLEKLRVRYPGRLGTAIVLPIQGVVAAALSPFYGWSRVRGMNWRVYWAQTLAKRTGR